MLQQQSNPQNHVSGCTRLAGELLDQPARLSFSFARDAVALNLCAEPAQRRILLRFDIASENWGRGADADPEKQRMAGSIARYIRSEFEGIFARLDRFMLDRKQGVLFEGPYIPASQACMELSIRVTLDANFDETYDHVQELLATHPRRDVDNYIHEWSETELVEIERMPKEPGTPEALMENMAAASLGQESKASRDQVLAASPQGEAPAAADAAREALARSDYCRNSDLDFLLPE